MLFEIRNAFQGLIEFRNDGLEPTAMSSIVSKTLAPDKGVVSGKHKHKNPPHPNFLLPGYFGGSSVLFFQHRSERINAAAFSAESPDDLHSEGFVR